MALDVGGSDYLFRGETTQLLVHQRGPHSNHVQGFWTHGETELDEFHQKLIVKTEHTNDLVSKNLNIYTWVVWKVSDLAYVKLGASGLWIGNRTGAGVTATQRV